VTARREKERCLRLIADEVKMGRVEMRQATNRRDKEKARHYVEVMTECFRVVHSINERGEPA
jgi:hypothetical protein